MNWERRLTKWLWYFLYVVVVFNLGMYAYHAKAAGRIDNEWTEGKWRYCEYSDGRILTIPIHDRCPRVIQ